MTILKKPQANQNITNVGPASGIPHQIKITPAKARGEMEKGPA